MNLDFDACERARLARDARFDGRFFIGVTTTGIYCRPVCPAPSPKSSNVRYYPTAAAAAEAGFRPCLRCRPEASPGTPAWLGAPATVNRALKLISESALDDEGVENLAERLGVGGRHLRRLFLRYLGATPVAVAQTRRLHFAKKLIDETALSFADIAMASGYGSIRRFNETFLKVYGRPPRELRRETRANSAAPEPGAYSLRLPYRPPYDWESLIEFLALRATPGVETVSPDEYRRTIELDGRTGSISVRRPKAGNYFDLFIRFPEPTALFRITERVRRIFDLGADPAEIGATLKHDSTLAPLVRKRPGMRVPGAWDGFEIGVRAILGQQVSVKAATTLAGRLATRFGRTVEDGVLFPGPADLCAAPVAEIGLPEARASAIRTFAQAICSGKLRFDGTLALDDFVDCLSELPGVGRWTAQYIAMRLGEPDAFPAGDLHLKRNGGDPERWRPWRAYAAMHLWKGNS